MGTVTLDAIIEKSFAKKEQLTNEEKQIIAAELPPKIKICNILSKTLHGAGLVSLWLWPWGHVGNFDYLTAFFMSGAYISAIRLSNKVDKYRAYLGTDGELEQKIVMTEISNIKVTPEIIAETEKRVSKYKTYISVGLPIAIAAGIVLFAYRAEDVLPLAAIATVLTGAVYGRIQRYQKLLKRS